MTGIAEGKLELKNAKVYLVTEKEKVELEALVFIHLKGYALARVTHLDIEHEVLDNIIPPEKGYFLSIHGVKGGIKIKLESEKEIKLKNRKISVKEVEVLHPFLVEVLSMNEKTRTWVGGKVGGIYIGFKKEQILRLEAIAREKFGMQVS